MTLTIWKSHSIEKKKNDPLENLRILCARTTDRLRVGGTSTISHGEWTGHVRCTERKDRQIAKMETNLDSGVKVCCDRNGGGGGDGVLQHNESNSGLDRRSFNRRTYTHGIL